MTIETERLLLRPFQEGDAEDVFEYLNEPAVNCFASMKLHSLEEAREEVLKRSSETEYYFAIVLKESGKVIGEIDAYPEPADEHGADSEMISFVKNPDGTPHYENTYQYAILKKEWDTKFL